MSPFLENLRIVFVMKARNLFANLLKILSLLSMKIRRLAVVGFEPTTNGL